MDENFILGMNVRYFRKKLNMKNETLAGLMKYSKSWLSNLENHKQKTLIDEDDIIRLADFLKTSRNILLGVDDIFSEKMSCLDEHISRRELGENVVKLSDGLILLAAERNGPRDQSLAVMKRGNIEYLKGEYLNALDLYTDALAISEGAFDFPMSQKLRQNIAASYVELGDYELAKHTIKRNISDLNDLHVLSSIPRIEQAKNHKILGTLYFQQEKWEKAFDHISRALEIIPSEDTSTLRGECLQVLGAIHFYGNRYCEAVDLSRDAIEHACKTGDVLCESYALRIIGNAELSLGNLERATYFLQEAKRKTPVERRGEHLELDILLMQCKTYDIDQYRTMLAIIEELEMMNCAPRKLARMYEQLAKVAIEIGLLLEASHHLQKAIQKLRDIII